MFTIYTRSITPTDPLIGIDGRVLQIHNYPPNKRLSLTKDFSSLFSDLEILNTLILNRSFIGG